jgi:hypothetical protein
MDRKDLPAFNGASLQHTAKDVGLKFQGSEKARPCIKPDLPDVPCLSYLPFELVYLAPVVDHDLRVKPKGRSHVFGRAREVSISFPGPGRRGHRQRVHSRSVAFIDQRGEIRIKIQMAMKVDESDGQSS